MGATSREEQSNDNAPGESVIEVNLDEADPAKAIERTTRTAEPRQRQAARDEDDDLGPRINREISKRMTRFSRSFNQQMAEQEARHNRELSALRQENERLRMEGRGSGDAGQSDHERKMAELTDKLTAAHERGDSSEAAKITAEMTRLEAAYHAKLSGTEVRRDAGGDAAPAARQADPYAPGAPPQISAAASRFIDANAHWWEDPEHQYEKNTASQIFVNLTREEGYRQDDPATFREVAKRLLKLYPTLDVQNAARDEEEDGGGNDPAANRETRRPRAPAARLPDRGGDNVRPIGNRATLGPKDIALMRQVNMDPENNDHVLRFIRERDAMEREAR